VVGDVAGVVGVIASVVGTTTDVDGTDRIYTSSVVVAVKLLKLMVNVKSSVTAMKSGMITIWVVWDVVCTPPTWRATVDES